MIATYKTRHGAERYARFLRRRQGVQAAKVVAYGFDLAVKVNIHGRKVYAAPMPGWTKEPRDG